MVGGVTTEVGIMGAIVGAIMEAGAMDRIIIAGTTGTIGTTGMMAGVGVGITLSITITLIRMTTITIIPMIAII
jgi:hypothetical protein